MDNLNVIWRKFFETRNNPLWTRFPGIYRSVVVETNDPLNMRRIRFKCPDLHDWDLLASDCPWAVVAPELGGKRAGTWVAPCIGDWVWIDFERGHPYGPVCVGFATPTRRRHYSYPSVYQPSPVSVNDQGVAVDSPDDYDPDYLPKDGRPMSIGRQDRYGHLDIMSSVGFFPREHDRAPPPPDFDPLQDADFGQAQTIPLADDPDVKYMARVTKYGHIFLLGDQGYTWKRDGDYGEFTGDAVDDEEFEVKRWKYLQRLLNEDKPSDNDQRHKLDLTRYGHKFEMRDTGWAQPGPVSSRSRQDEYGDPIYLSREMVNDYRWVKLRTKGGWLMQAYDKGFDPQDDEFVKRLLMDETGARTEREDVHWADRDARWFRIVGRHGMKFVIDERGTDPKNADGRENPRANGVLIKGRRTGGCLKDGPIEGDPRGFYFEFNENDRANHTTWGSPLGQVIEMNDATEYMCLAVGVGRDYARPHRGLEENEFLLEPTRARDPENRSYHLVLDHENEYLRLKTRAGGGDSARDPVNPSALGGGDLNQGLEAHDGVLGDGPWVELVDSEHRGLWLSRYKKLGIWRARQDKKMYVWLDDDHNNVVIHNGEDGGHVQVYCKNDVEIIAEGDITFRGDNINFKADQKIRFEAGSNRLTIEDGKLSTLGDIYGSTAYVRLAAAPSFDDVKAIAEVRATTNANTVASSLASVVENTLTNVNLDATDRFGGAIDGRLDNTNVDFSPKPSSVVAPAVPSGAGDPTPGGDAVDEPQRINVPILIEPTDRAVTYNEPSVCPQDEVEHPVN